MREKPRFRTGRFWRTNGSRQSIKRIPTIGWRDRIGVLLALRGDLAGFLQRLHWKYGDIVRVRILGKSIIVLNHPDYFEHVLVRNHRNYDKKTYLYKVVEPAFGNGIIGYVGGKEWLRQRRLIQPSFHRSQVAALLPRMTGPIAETMRRWRGSTTPGEIINIADEVRQLSLNVVFATLFGGEAEAKGISIRDLFVEAHQILSNFFRRPFPPLSWPTPTGNRLREIIGTMDRYIDQLVRDRLHSGKHGDDLLSILIDELHHNAEMEGDRELLGQEVQNIMIGGYETVSTTMQWLLYLVATHPEVQERLQHEVDDQLSGSVPAYADLTRLTYTRMVVEETLRYYPPAWHMMRRAVAEDDIAGYRVPAHSEIYVNIFLLHHHPGIWPSPDIFDPDRFSAEQVARRPRNAYVPFGSGPRKCVGDYFAVTELTLFLGMVAQAYRLVPPRGHGRVQVDQLLTLRPKGGVPLSLERRT
jgi:cytochrome P450